MTITDLPAVNACLNGLSALFLGAGYILIKRGSLASPPRFHAGRLCYFDPLLGLLSDVPRLSRLCPAPWSDPLP